jgi:hypothetical protein
MAHSAEPRVDVKGWRLWAAIGAWVALVIGASALHRWLKAPLEATLGLPLMLLLLLTAAVHGGLSTSGAARLINRRSTPSANAWTTARTVRLKHCLPLLISCVLLIDLSRLALALWAVDERVRAATAAALIFLPLAAIVVEVRRAFHAIVELRIDADGIFTPKWKGVLGWDKIEHVVQPAGSDRTLRLMVGPGAAPGLSSPLRANGGFLSLPLEAAGVSAHDALAALRAARPTLTVTPWNSNGFVLAIKGATDVPDIAPVTDGPR